MASPGNPNQQQPLFNPNGMVPASAAAAYPLPSSSYPPPSGPYPFHHAQYLPYPPPPSHPQDHQFFQNQLPGNIHPNAYPAPTGPNPGGARLLALLGTQTASAPLDLQPHPFTQSPSAPPEFLISVRPPEQVPSAPSPMRLLSTKLPKGRHLIGDRVVYDIDVKIQGEVHPQLEVTPITKYVSDPGLVLGRQIAVNRSYICYGLKMGNIRVLNINTALRSLLRGHTQRVTDMAFFAEDVHLLASASSDGRVFIWRINEGPDEEDKAQISAKVVLAVQLVGEEESVHPQLCWHPHKQENLMVAIGKRVLKIDTTRFGKRGAFSPEEPLKCPLDKLINGIQLIGEHDAAVTDLAMCQWMTTRLASASLDGTVKIWQDRRQPPLAVIRPHDGNPVNSVTFLTSPQRPDHIVLITGGAKNREVKVWASTSEEGWLLPSESESWQCTQTLELKSSAQAEIDDAFFNQVVALPRAGLFLLANAKKNAIYAVHIDYRVNPASTRMDYIAEFTVTMPILSVTGTSESLGEGEHIIQVYCVQTQAIQQYALALSQCLPPPLDNAEIERTESAISSSMVDAVNTEVTAINKEAKSYSEAVTSNLLQSDNILTASPPVPLSPRISRMSSGFLSPSNSFGHLPPITDQSGGDNDRIESPATSGPIMFKQPTHLVTPSEILSRPPSSDTLINQGSNVGELKVQDVVVNQTEGVEVEVKVVGETGISKNSDHGYEREAQVVITEKKEQTFYSQGSNLSKQMSRDFSDDNNNYSTEGINRGNSVGTANAPNQSISTDTTDKIPEKVDVSETSAALGVPTTTSKGKKKGKTSQVGPSSSSPSPLNSTDSSICPNGGLGLQSGDGASPNISTMQEVLSQLVGMQVEMQKQLNTIVSGPVNKEGKRLEASLGRHMEKLIKANNDALWARFQEENAKHEKLEHESAQQITNAITSCVASVEKNIRKELAAVGPSVVRAITPVLEKSILTAITESFQKGVGEKAINQLEKTVNSKLEGTVARQIQVQFQTSGKQALQDALRSSMDASIIPAFEMQIRAVFEQIDSSLQNGLVKHLSAAQQQFDSTHSPLAIALRDAINSASSMTQTLSGELADGQRKLMAAAVAGAGSSMGNPLVTQLSNGPLAAFRDMQPEAPVDPTKELSRLIGEQKYEEAFTAALHRSDVSIVSWLCNQVDLQRILSLVPVPLSQGVLLALLQQLACDIGSDTARKLTWMTDVAVAINPVDPMIVVHVRPIFEQVYQILGHQRSLPTTAAAEANSIRLLMHVINSVLMSCK